jgi:hypothetical protein
VAVAVLVQLVALAVHLSEAQEHLEAVLVRLHQPIPLVAAEVAALRALEALVVLASFM